MFTYFSKYSYSYFEWLYHIFFCIRNLTRSIFDTQPVVRKSFFGALSSWWSILYFCIIEHPLSVFIYASKAITLAFNPQNIDFRRYILIVLVRPGFFMALEKQRCIKHVFYPIYTYLTEETTVYEESDLSTKLGYVSLELLIKIMLNCIQTRSQGFSYLVPRSLTVNKREISLFSVRLNEIWVQDWGFSSLRPSLSSIKS